MVLIIVENWRSRYTFSCRLTNSSKSWSRLCSHVRSLNSLNLIVDLRLQLLEPDKYPHLFKCLYGILMLLPQSSAFATLRNRLHSISPIGYFHLLPRG